MAKHNKKRFKSVVVLLHIIGLLGLLMTSFQCSAGNKPPIVVFVSILPQKYFVQQVGGDKVEVNVMVGPGQSPETYEPSPRQMEKLSHATFYFRMGVPFEHSWMERIKSLYPHLIIIDAREGITLRHMAEDTNLFASPGEEAIRNKRAKDPHIWTNPKNVAIFMKHFSDILAQEYPQYGRDFNANYQRFAAKLIDLDNKVKTLFKPVKKKYLLVYHPSWGYFAQQYGLTQISIEVEGKSPNAKSMAKIIEFARQNNLNVIFTQKQFSQRNAQAVANAIGGKVMAVDPLAEDYTVNMFYVAKQFARSMR